MRPARAARPVHRVRHGRRALHLALAALAIELALLALESLLVHAIGQEPIAAAMLSVPSGRTALLGAAAVLARIAGHALFPALAVGAAVALGVAGSGRTTRPGGTMDRVAAGPPTGD